MTTQQAYRLHSYDALDRHRLEDVPMPQPGKGQVLVQVSMVGVNPFDWKLRDGHVKDFVPLPLPAILGVDFVGKVVKLGEGTSRLAIGDRVSTMSTTLGAYAEYIAVNEATLGRVPDSLTDEQAATIPIPALTAWQTLEAAGAIDSDTSILIQGASGLVGSFAVQFARARGARVIGVASGKNRQYVLGLGADEFIDYREERFEDVAKDIDIVLDYITIGDADGATNRSFAVLKKGGTLISVADPGVSAKAPDGYTSAFPDIKPDADRLELFGKQLAAGQLKSKVARVYSRGKVNEAIDANRAGGIVGRLLVDFQKV